MKAKRRGRPPKSIDIQEKSEQDDVNVNLDLDNKLLVEFNIKDCSVELNPINIEQSAMDETSPAPVATPKRRGRPKSNKTVNKLKAAAAAATASPAPATPTKTTVVDDTPTKADELDDTAKLAEKIDVKNESDANESIEKVEKPPKPSLSERKLAKKAEIEALMASGGRGKRTPKPNPRYMDEPVSANKSMRDENDLEPMEGGEDGDDEMNLSSDEPRHEGPPKKRILQKIGIKSGPGRKPGSGKGTPGRKPGSGAAGYKRKLEIDIDIDDDRGKQLFLDAKRRFQNSPSGSDDDAQFKKSKSPITDVLAAKLLSKYPAEFTAKRNVTTEKKISPINRARFLERNKVALEKDGSIELRKRKLTEDTETSEDDLGMKKESSDQEASSPKNINRRKTQHTKILSDDKIVRATTSTSIGTAQIVRRQIGGTNIIAKQINKTPLTQNQLSQIKSQAATKTYSISPQSRTIGGSNKPAILRQPPRILNSTLCKPTNKATVVPSLVTKVVTKDDYDELGKKRNNNIISSRSKENNVTSYVYTEKDGKMIPKKTVVQQITPQQQKLMQQRKTVLPVVRTPSTQQRIISEPVIMNIPNSKRIRKITCFETWYVIKMVEEQPKHEKSVLALSLMQIGNEIKKIELPSNEWTYKILLQPLTKQLLELRKTKANEKAIEMKPKSSEESKQTGDKSETKNDTDTTAENKETDIKTEIKEEDKIDEETTSAESKSVETPKDEPKTLENTETADKSDVKEEKSEEKEETKDAKSDEKPGNGTDEKTEPTSEDSAESESKATESKEADSKETASKDIKSKETKSKDTKSKETTSKETRSKVAASKEAETKKANAKKAEEKKLNAVEENESEKQNDKKLDKNGNEDKTKQVQSETNDKHDVYTGEVHDPNINPDERHNYRPINIMFRRKCQNPNIRIQFDRTVILKNQTFYLNIDGKNVRLLASPQTIETYDDIKTLLQIVNDISLSSCCVEPVSQIS